MSTRFYFSRFRPVLVFMAGLSLAACQSPPPTDAGEHAGTVPAEAGTSIFVASNGWHSTIVIARSDLRPNAIPELADFPDAAYVAFGWGDADYFPARDASIATTLAAALLPTPSVLHVSGLAYHPRTTYPRDEVIALRTTAAGLGRLTAYLNGSFERNGAERASASAPGLDPQSLFYRARGSFHLFNTCNSWTARALRSAGQPVDSSNALDAESLMAQLRPLRERDQPRTPAR